MGIKQELGLKIKRMRINRGLTQEQLAEKVNVSQRTMSGIEIGENFVTAETLDKIITALNTTSEELFATDHLKEQKYLFEEIQNDIKLISQNPQKLETLYNIVKSLKKE
ncbi:helix-turn-helix transcriptional regulator [bacterium]|nr:helix-turn-helix transcriptional regulator [bacterium]